MERVGYAPIKHEITVNTDGEQMRKLHADSVERGSVFFHGINMCVQSCDTLITADGMTVHIVYHEIT